MAGEITKLRYQKRTASLTRLENYINNLDVDTCEIEQLKVRIAKLDEIYKTFNKVQSELVAKDDTISERDLETEAEEIQIHNVKGINRKNGEGKIKKGCK